MSLVEAEERFGRLDRELANALAKESDPDAASRLKTEWRESLTTLQREWTVAARDAERDTGARL